MTLKQYLIIMAFATLICWLIWTTIIFAYDPEIAGLVGFMFFYVSLYLSILGTFSIIVFLIRSKIINNDEIIFRHIRRTFRQGIFFSFLVVIILLLAQFGFLTWWTFALIFTCYVFLESLIFTNRKYQNRNYVK